MGVLSRLLDLILGHGARVTNPIFLWAGSSNWESASLAPKRFGVRDPVGPPFMGMNLEKVWKWYHQYKVSSILTVSTSKKLSLNSWRLATLNNSVSRPHYGLSGRYQQTICGAAAPNGPTTQVAVRLAR